MPRSGNVPPQVDAYSGLLLGNHLSQLFMASSQGRHALSSSPASRSSSWTADTVISGAPDRVLRVGKKRAQCRTCFCSTALAKADQDGGKGGVGAFPTGALPHEWLGFPGFQRRAVGFKRAVPARCRSTGPRDIFFLNTFDESKCLYLFHLRFLRLCLNRIMFS